MYVFPMIVVSKKSYVPTAPFCYVPHGMQGRQPHSATLGLGQSTFCLYMIIYMHVYTYMYACMCIIYIIKMKI